MRTQTDTQGSGGKMPDLAALPLEVRIPRLSLALDFVGACSLSSRLLRSICLSGSSALYASPSQPAVHKRKLDLVCAACRCLKML